MNDLRDAAFHQCLDLNPALCLRASVRTIQDRTRGCSRARNHRGLFCSAASTPRPLILWPPAQQLSPIERYVSGISKRESRRQLGPLAAQGSIDDEWPFTQLLLSGHSSHTAPTTGTVALRAIHDIRQQHSIPPHLSELLLAVGRQQATILEGSIFASARAMKEPLDDHL